MSSSNVKDSAAGRNEFRIFRITPDSDYFQKELPTPFFKLLQNYCKIHINHVIAIFIQFHNYYDKSDSSYKFVHAKKYSPILLRHNYLS